MPSDPRQAALAAVEVFCESRVPEGHRDEVRLECSRRGYPITIVERRPPWSPELIGPSTKVAQLRYDQSAGRWSLYWCGRNERWWPYDNIEPSASIDRLLGEIDADPTGIFWG